MAAHIVTGNGSPTVIPTSLAQHYVDLTNGAIYQSVGTNSIADWKPSTSVTSEQIQDVIGPMFDNTASAPITTAYDDVNNRVVTAIDQTQINHNLLQNVGTNSHNQIDNHLASTANPHGVTKSQVGLSNVDNTSDLNKPISNATQTALNSKVNNSEKGVANGVATLDASAKIPTGQIPSLPYAPTSHTHTSSQITDFSSSVQAIGDVAYSPINHTHADATPSTSGFMSAADKSKLDGLVNDVVTITNANVSNSSNNTFSTLDQLALTVVAGRVYVFEFLLRFQTAANATGIGMSIGGTASGSLTANANAISGTGTAGLYSGPLTALNGVITTSGVPSANTPYLARITGIFVASTSGFIQPQFRSEINGSTVTVLANSVGTFKEIQ